MSLNFFPVQHVLKDKRVLAFVQKQAAEEGDESSTSQWDLDNTYVGYRMLPSYLSYKTTIVYDQDYMSDIYISHTHAGAQIDTISSTSGCGF